MPWTAEDADRHKAGLSAEAKRVWARVANQTLADCQKKGSSDCEGRAVRVANAAAGRVGKIAKVDDRGLVYGWASIVVQDGQDVVDSQGDVIEPAELEDAMVDFMKHHRATGEMHLGDATGVVVEAFTMTPDKLLAMGFPDQVAETMPVGAWIGVQLDPTSETFAKVKAGELRMFSVQGTGERVPL